MQQSVPRPEDLIKANAARLGADVCGIASIDRFADAPAGYTPCDLFAACQSVVAVGVALPTGLYDVAPRLIYSHFNAELCTIVDALTLRLAKEMERRFGCRAVPLPSDAPNEYWDADTMTAKGLLSMKHTAVQCGLGSLGKSTLLLNAAYGNRLTVGALLTDLTLESDPLQPDLCVPQCRRCIEACPAQAIENDTVDQLRCRLHAYGATARGFATVDCNACRTACPLRLGSSATGFPAERSST